jgi:hypothetical protein
MSKYQPVLVSVDPASLQRNPWNPNVVSAANEDKLKSSIEELGQFKPLIVRELEDGSLEILGGEHRNDQAIRMGLKEVQVYNLGKIDDDLAKKISLADNAQYGENDFASLAELMKSLENPEHLADIMPITADEIQSMVSHDTVDFDSLNLDPDTDTSTETLDLPSAVKTHSIMRFKVAMEDMAVVTETVNRVKTAQNFTEADALTNAGDALVYIIQEFRRQNGVQEEESNDLTDETEVLDLEGENQ